MPRALVSEPFREGWRCEWPWQRRRKERARQAGRGWNVPVPQHQVCCFDRRAVHSDHKESAIHAIHRLLQHLPPRIANADQPLCAYLLIAPGMRPHDPWHRIQALYWDRIRAHVETVVLERRHVLNELNLVESCDRIQCSAAPGLSARLRTPAATCSGCHAYSFFISERVAAFGHRFSRRGCSSSDHRRSMGETKGA